MGSDAFAVRAGGLSLVVVGILALRVTRLRTAHVNRDANRVLQCTCLHTSCEEKSATVPPIGCILCAACPPMLCHVRLCLPARLCPACLPALVRVVPVALEPLRLLRLAAVCPPCLRLVAKARA